MYLLVDAVTTRDLLLLLVDGQGKLISRRLIKEGSCREVFLNKLVDFLSDQQATNKIIGLAGVNEGGTFSQVRQSCVLLNALAWAWTVPVITWSGQDKVFLAIIQRIKKAEIGSFIQPRYSGPGVG
ncbi:hypothetical protein KKC17_03970 [Patescibacteria group bacterium]|nr:hypothetical protein [Patescibacteria group bacterium]